MTLLNTLDVRALESFVAAHHCALTAERRHAAPAFSDESGLFSSQDHRAQARRLRQWIEMRRA